jgi:hypothetical protein
MVLQYVYRPVLKKCNSSHIIITLKSSCASPSGLVQTASVPVEQGCKLGL